jgi:hypothetical protein
MMLNDGALMQVWCETQDDVTLIWANGNTEEVEFVQVKSHEFEQLWSIAKLLEKETVSESKDDGDTSTSSTKSRGSKGTATGESKGGKKRETRCILEKSLQYDRCQEPVRFRLVTVRAVKDELRYLTHPVGDAKRDKSKSDYVYLHSKVKEKIADFRSPNGNDCVFWLERTIWEWVDSLESLTQKNLWTTTKLVDDLGQYLTTDQVEEVYKRLLTRVYDAGLANWDRDASKKKIGRADLMAWFRQAVNEESHPAQFGTGKKLEEKLSDAGIPSDQFEAIAEMRHRYRLERLSPKYAAGKVPVAEAGIRAKLMTLRARLDGQILEANGVAFHAMCLQAIDAIRASIKAKDRPDAEHLYGYMYALTDRCTHRFVRAKT